MFRYQPKGFTLIELLVVIAIIGLLATFAVVQLTSSRDKAEFATAQAFSAQLYRTMGAEAIGVWNLDEGSGNTVYNSSANSNSTGIVTGGVWDANGPLGKPALQLSGTANVSLGTLTLPVRTTVAMWVKSSFSGSQQPMFSNRGGGLFFGTNGGKVLAYYSVATPPAMYSNAIVVDGKWHHVVWTSDGSTSKIYIDGKLDSTISQARTAQTGPAYIGWDAALSTQYYQGSIAQVAVYSDFIR